jgi:hypothetical protein
MIEVPNLDTIDFDALVDEGRRLIPRYAPDWTDHNLHDPGMTLLDLLAWFVDQQVYRIGFVGDAHIAAFAALLGVTAQSAKAAGGLIWPNRGVIPSDRTIAKDQRVHPAEQPELAFVVTDTIGLRATVIDRVEARAGAATRSTTLEDTGAVLLDDATGTIDLVFDAAIAGGVSPIALGLAYAGPLPDLGGRPPVAAFYRDAAGTVQQVAAEWRAAPDGASGVLLLPPPAAGNPAAAIRLDLAANPARRLLPVRVALNVLPVTQIEILDALKIGEGTGWPDLELMLGLEEGSALTEPLSIESGANGRAWTAIADFAASGPTNAHFLFDPDRGTLRFGNGINGLAVPAGEEVSRGVLRVTRGASGNLGAGTSWSVPGATASDTTNFGVTRAAMAGGADAWTREEFLDALRRQARKRAAMLTDDDMIGAVAELTGYGIERAEVVPRFVPTLPRREMPGARTLLLRPARGVDASDAWLDAIAGNLAARRVLGERLAVTVIEPVAVAVDVTLLVAAGSDQERIRTEVRQRLRERLSIDKMRDDQTIDPWPAGRPVTIAELETLTATVDGVIAVTDLLIARAGQARANMSLPLSRIEAAVIDEPVIQFRVEH